MVVAAHPVSAPVGRPGPPLGVGEPAVVVRDLVVERGAVRILHGVGLDVPRGAVFGLVGPSGCGKSTLIRTLVGRQKATSGTVRVLGQPAGSLALRPALGYMPQDAAVYDDLSGRENLSFFAAVYRAPASRVAEMLDLADLTAVADRPVRTYSGGQRQRIALAAALLPAPQLLLLDEPTVGLDPRLRRRLWAQFHAWAAAGTTLLVTTHVMDEAAHADCLALMAQGQVVAVGTPDELLVRSGADDLEDALLRLTAEIPRGSPSSPGAPEDTAPTARQSVE